MATRLITESAASKSSLLSIAHGTSLGSFSSHINLSCFFIKIFIVITTETFYSVIFKNSYHHFHFH